jgi:hypothetical protein
MRPGSTFRVWADVVGKRSHRHELLAGEIFSPRDEAVSRFGETEFATPAAVCEEASSRLTVLLGFGERLRVRSDRCAAASPRQWVKTVRGDLPRRRGDDARVADGKRSNTDGDCGRPNW